MRIYQIADCHLYMHSAASIKYALAACRTLIQLLECKRMQLLIINSVNSEPHEVILPEKITLVPSTLSLRGQ